MTENPPSTLAPARRALKFQLETARERTRQISEQIDLFSSRLEELRRIAAAEPQDPKARSEPTRRRAQQQEGELTLALEELLAQNSALRETEDALTEERARYEDLFEHAPDAYVTTDERGVIREANRAAAELFGFTSKGLPGKLLIAFVARSDTRAFRQMLVTLRDPGTYASSLRLRPRGGVPFRVALSVRTVVARGDTREVRWTVRPAREPPSQNDRELLADVGRLLRDALDDIDREAHAALAEDLEQLALAAEPSAPGSLTPGALLEIAIMRAAAIAPSTRRSLVLGSVDDGVNLRLGAERVAWALARLLTLLGSAKLRAWRRGSSTYAIEIRGSSEPVAASGRVAQAAVYAALAAEGCRLRVEHVGCERRTTVYEITLPLQEDRSGAR